MTHFRTSSFLVGLAVMAATLGLWSTAAAQAQQPEYRPVSLGQPMPDFTLPVYQAGTLTLSTLKGKNVMIVVPRVYAAEGRWCTICNYQYIDFVESERAEQARKAFNFEILVLFPFGQEHVQKWLDSFPDQMEKIKTWKYPPQPETLDQQGRDRMERMRKFYPKDYAVKAGEVPVPFLIVMDAERKLSQGLGVFALEWGGSKTAQGIPSVFILDSNGILQFKYIGQNTADRPSFSYLMNILKMVAKKKLS